ncbi:MAG: glutamine synthetase [Leptospiraceae bacterium]|nr:glutamine synthetase [Leptospiraceae bacterium]
MTAEEIIRDVSKSGTRKVKVAITDIDGVLRGKYIHLDKFLSASQGRFGFCNVVFGWDAADVTYDNCKYTGWHTGYPDAPVQLDLQTYRKIPWDNNTPFFLGDFVDENNEPLSICPRNLLKKIVDRAKSMGYQSKCGVELEFFNFAETPESLHHKKFRDLDPLTPGMFGYSILRSTYDQPYFSTLMDELEAFHVPLEGLHTETGPGVFEAGIYVADALEAGDRAVLFKTAVKEIAYRFDIIPTFMARWNTELPGCSGHIHQSLWDQSGERNVFYAENDPHKMSDTFRHYLAGLMHCLPDILPMMAPNINSYKRLVEGFWAPTTVTWGVDNRTASFRVIPGSMKSTRVETRVGGSDINAYLAIAAFLAAGLYGIQNKLELKAEPIKGNAYEAQAPRLPNNLYDAAQKMGQSKLARELFGDEFVDHYVNSRIWEWNQFRAAVTSWELERYFEII